MIERLTTSQTAVRLTEYGYPVSRRWLATLIKKNEGPKIQRQQGTRPTITIRWDYALEWARRSLCANAMKQDVMLTVAQIEAMDRNFALDLIIFWLKSNHPAKWQDVLKTYHKADRRAILNQLANSTIDYAESLWNKITPRVE